MEPKDQNQNYSYTPPVNQQPQVVYVERPQKNNFLKYILGCTFLLLLVGCICVMPVVFLASLGSQLGSTSLDATEDNISEDQFTRTGNTSSSEKAKLAVINVTGAISYTVPGSDTYEVGATSNNLISQILKAKNDDTVDAVLLRFNTPGGEVSAAEPVCQEIRSLSEKKPTFSFIDSTGASLGYLLPNCTKYIYARPDAMTGSIGVVIQAVDFYGILENFGGKVVFVTNSEGDQKTGQEIYDPNSETYKIYQSMLDETYEYFIDVVYSGRKINNPSLVRDSLKQYADGRVYSGTQAKKIGLVDELGQLNDVLRSITDKEQKLKNKDVSVVEYSITTSPFDQFFYGMKASLRSNDIKENLKESGQMKLMMQQGIITSGNKQQKEEK